MDALEAGPFRPPAPPIMSNPNAETAPIAKPAPLWEDFIDIFHSPSEVYERRRDANPWPMLLIITVLATAIGVLTWNSLSPIFESEMRAQFAKGMAANPQITQDMVDSQIKVGMFMRRWGAVFYPIFALLFALLVWLLGKIVGAKELTYTRALVSFAWASIITIVQALALGVQGLLLDVSTITASEKIGFSPARFLSQESTSPFLYGALKTLDLFTIWWVVVIAIGVRVTGRGTKNTTIAFAATWIIVSALIAGAFAARAG